MNKDRVLEIIKLHRVFVAFLLNSKCSYEYNSRVTWSNSSLTDEEYDLLKEALS